MPGDQDRSEKPARSLRGLLLDERGLETVEYAIIVAILASGTIAALTAIGVWVAGRYTTAQTALGA